MIADGSAEVVRSADGATYLRLPEEGAWLTNEARPAADSPAASDRAGAPPPPPVGPPAAAPAPAPSGPAGAASGGAEASAAGAGMDAAAAAGGAAARGATLIGSLQVRVAAMGGMWGAVGRRRADSEAARARGMRAT